MMVLTVTFAHTTGTSALVARGSLAEVRKFRDDHLHAAPPGTRVLLTLTKERPTR